MALTTFDQAIAGASQPVFVFKSIVANMEAAGAMASRAYDPGFPGEATVPSPGLAGEALTSWTGQIPLTAAGRIMAVSGASSSTTPGGVIIADRLWQNSGVVATTTTAQSLGTPVAIPARDADGTTAGRGVLAAIEINATSGTAGVISNTTISYTNSAGTSGRTGTMPLPIAMPAGPLKGTFIPFSLEGSDQGVRSIESITLGTSYVTAGCITLVLFRPVWVHSETTAGRGFHMDCLSGGAPEIFANSCLFLLHDPSSAATPVTRLIIHHTAGV